MIVAVVGILVLCLRGGRSLANPISLEFEELSLSSTNKFAEPCKAEGDIGSRTLFTVELEADESPNARELIKLSR